jgi:hypothetical protein
VLARRFIRRLPIRARVSLAFAVVLAIVLAATGLFLDLRFAAETNRAIDQGLRSRAGDVIALVRQADSGLATAGDTNLNNKVSGFAQILDRRDGVFDSTPQTGRRAQRTRPRAWQPPDAAADRATLARRSRRRVQTQPAIAQDDLRY